MTAYTLFGQTGGGHIDSFTDPLLNGVAFSVSAAVTLTGIWWYSASGAGQLPVACGVFDSGTHLVVTGTQDNSPTWSGAAGSGWVRCGYDGSVTLSPSSSYVAAVWNGATGGQQWYSISSGPVSPITSGPLSSPSDPSRWTESASFSFPDQTYGDNNIWADVEVSAGGIRSSLMLATGIV
jgi:hypothetical protein